MVPAEGSVVTDMRDLLGLVVVLDVQMTALDRAAPFRGGQAVGDELIKILHKQYVFTIAHRMGTVRRSDPWP
jgi:hypothetical protein